jgi:hypothetical protein
MNTLLRILQHVICLGIRCRVGKVAAPTSSTFNARPLTTAVTVTFKAQPFQGEKALVIADLVLIAWILRRPHERHKETQAIGPVL